MCQLLGVSSNMDVDIQFSIREFQSRGRINLHGWGFSFFQNGNWKIIKKPSSLASENITQDQFRLKSKIIIGHVRLASCGRKTHQNTHPFERSNLVFAHNGTVSQIKSKKEFLLKNFKPRGETDSEYAFCYFLDKIGDETDIDKIRDILQTESEKIKEFGKFNYLLSNGDVIFAYGDNSLYFVQRKSPFREVTLKDEHCSIRLSEIKAPDEKAIIIATEPLTVGESWERFSGIKMFKDGESI